MFKKKPPFCPFDSLRDTVKKHFDRNYHSFQDMTKKLFFHSDHKKGTLTRNVYSFRDMTKIRFFIVITEKHPFARNVDIRRVITKQRCFHSDAKTNALLLETSIVYDVCSR